MARRRRPRALAKTLPGSQPCSTAIQPPPQPAADALIRGGSFDDRDFASSELFGFLATEPVFDHPIANQASELSRTTATTPGG